MKLTGKTALVVGSSPNIGGGIAEGLADEEANVVCVDLNPAYAHGCADWIKGRGGKAIGLVCDVTNEDQVRATVDGAIAEFGRVDILVNGAVIFNQKGVLSMPVAEWRAQIDVILTGAFLFTKHVTQKMIDQGRHGSVISIISSAGHQGQPGNVGYCTGKSGLLNFTRSVAMELAEHGIRVNSLTPTGTDATEGTERAAQWGVEWPPPRNVARVRGMVPNSRLSSPMQKLPGPSHYGKAAVFLSSDDAEMITGFDLRVDAGTVSRYWAWDPGTAE